MKNPAAAGFFFAASAAREDWFGCVGQAIPGAAASSLGWPQPGHPWPGVKSYEPCSQLFTQICP